MLLSPGTNDGSDDERTRRTGGERPHVLIESGCIRELAAHVLSRPEYGTVAEEITVRQTERETLITQIVRQFPQYEQLIAVIGKHDGCRPTPAHCTLTAAVDAGTTWWEVVAFEITYPQTELVYLIIGRPVDRPTDSVAVIVDPGPNNTATVFEITTERVVPFRIPLDGSLPESSTEQRSTTTIGYNVAIDWFVS